MIINNIHIDISPNKKRKVCQNCKYFSKWGVHMGVCSKPKARIADRMDNETCKKFEYDTNS